MKINKKISKYSVTIGSIIEDIEVPSSSGKNWKISEVPTPWIVLYFYPKDSTPSCTLESSDFSRLFQQFKKNKATVYGISRDSIKSHLNFINKQNYCLELLSDKEEKLCRAFDVIQEKNMYGKTVVGIERSTFILNKEGKIFGEWRKVKVDGHAADVLEFLKNECL